MPKEQTQIPFGNDNENHAPRYHLPEDERTIAAMFDEKHVALLRHSVSEWNAWRASNESIIPKLAESDLVKANLAGADLRSARMHGANLNQANLRGAKLYGARLGEANLSSAFLEEAGLDGADLTGANLKKAHLYRARLEDAKLFQANLSQANLCNTWLRKTNLEEANLSGARLTDQGSSFFGAQMDSANLRRANLTGADLHLACLMSADLRGANLSSANFREANLRGALLDRCVMIDTDLRNADLTDASIYGISAWSLRTHGAKQQNLVLRRTADDSPFTVDDIEVAQFIYMMLDNARVRKVIDKITSKVVLILGRFSPERKAILDGLRDELRKRNYLPIVFDFEKPDNRDLTETIGTLAHLARFVIADLTEAKSLPQELQTIVPNLPSVPVQPIILAGAAEYAMFEHFPRYDWVLPGLQYRSLESLIGGMEDHIIKPAEAKAQAQTGYRQDRAEFAVI